MTALLWRAYGEGKVTEAEAEALSGLIEARTDAPAARRYSLAAPAASDPSNGPTAQERARSARSFVGSRPRSDTSLERRRRWAASGRLPPGLAARFTLAEQAVLALVATETSKRGDCRLAVGHLAAIAGVAETTVRNALREAKRLGLVTVEERRVTGFRNDTNVVRIVSPEWQAWMRLARKPVREILGAKDNRAAPSGGGGCKSAKRTNTGVLILSESGTTEPSKGCREAAGDLDRSDRTRIRAGRGTGRAMR
ncbi:DNA-binding transcriptional regulator YhcF (GntR family) [Methylobacterium brachiatum]|uniref:DNA-binding transcriptional regulator YhcF (GntR family) n=1 Tax=Methylobacterium brachiatum TaxID=269660 RepID=A0AAJ1TV42_9HYPH|nr:DNA-binding transcriptional regulator YhcF (GntR family) [Methylobacterium brachiatum]